MMKMLKTPKKESIADKIAQLLSTKAPSFDPEDNFDEETKAKVASDSEEIGDEDEPILSQFRKQNVDLLEDVDKKYAGKKGSRRDLYESDEDSEEFDEGAGNGSTEVEENSSDDEREEDDSDENLETKDDSDEDLETNNDDDGSLETIDEAEASFTHMDTSTHPKELQKGTCVRNQLNIWENLLEMRIQLQKCLMDANKMPQQETFTELKESNSSDFTDKIESTKQNLSMVLNKLLLLQNLFIGKYPETKILLKGGKEPKTIDDEEIPSDSNEEEEEETEQQESEQPHKKKLKLNEYEKEISKNHIKYSKYRDSVIQKWNEKTQIGVIKKDASAHSVLNQIQHNLTDKPKLIKRTQLKRTHFDVIGKKKPEPNPQEETTSRIPTEEYDPEIFDDNDFYHQLLRELIEVKSSDITDPVQLSRQWVQLQNLRSKMKRNIDTRATKGRKIRYAVHTKLINFMAPIDRTSLTEEAKHELFNSLFGKKNKK